MEQDKIYVIYYKDKPIHEADVYSKDKYGTLIKKVYPKKLYTREGYARNALRYLYKHIEKECLTIVVYEKSYTLEDEK